ncbi:TIGR02391 family protein [Streptomyces sp. M41]|uniref:TIGR02391 family protein n=1 Tax=Streptomyces sp. M41 TaxID=3059412 RepID=UPI00374D47EA
MCSSQDAAATHCWLFLREDVAELCAAALIDGRFDGAIFTAFRNVEAEVQRRTGFVDVIGGRLLAAAFVEDGPRQIKVSRRTGDQQRLHQMFDGAIGLHRGDRAHKDKPSLVCRTRSECLRVLAHACVLLDLLDRDMAVALAGLGYSQGDDTLTLRVERATPATWVLIDEQRCQVQRRDQAAVTISTAGIPTGARDRYRPRDQLRVIGRHIPPVVRRWDRLRVDSNDLQRLAGHLEKYGLQVTVDDSVMRLNATNPLNSRLTEEILAMGEATSTSPGLTTRSASTDMSKPAPNASPACSQSELRPRPFPPGPPTGCPRRLIDDDPGHRPPC